MGTTEEELLKEVETVNALRPDIIEWRVDVFEQVESLEAVSDMISKLRSAVPITCCFSLLEAIKRRRKQANQR